jgi:hypothetical protein
MSGIPALSASFALTGFNVDGSQCQQSRHSGLGDLLMTAVTPPFPPQIDEPALRQFRLDLFDIGEDGEEDLELVIKTPEQPSVKKHASLAALYMLAVMTLDRDGTIERTVNALLADGAINEVDAVNRITLLLNADPDDIELAA